MLYWFQGEIGFGKSGSQSPWRVLAASVPIGWIDLFLPGFPQSLEDDDKGNESDSSVDSGSSSGPNFNYILGMPLWCLTKEKVEDLLKQRDTKVVNHGDGILVLSQRCRIGDSGSSTVKTKLLAAVFADVKSGKVTSCKLDLCCYAVSCIIFLLQKAELNELQRKSSEDLWKEDLAVFIEELDVSVLRHWNCYFPVQTKKQTLNNSFYLLWIKNRSWFSPLG